MPFLVRMLLKQLLGSKELESRLFAALRDAAKLTETRFDDEAIDELEDIWAVAIPILTTKL